MMSQPDPPNPETKTISVKGVDNHLYIHYSSLVKLSSVNSGTHFSHILAHYMHFLKPGTSLSSNPKSHYGKKVDIEIIENLSSLHVKKADFGKEEFNIKYVFKNIQELTFDKDVSTEIFFKFVQSIHNSKVRVLGNISRIVIDSIDNSTMRSLTTSGDQKDITIRNVIKSIYDEFVGYCQKEGITVGEGISNMLREMIPRMEISEIVKNLENVDLGSLLILSMRDTYELSISDLEELEGFSVLIHRIKYLKFQKNMPLDLYRRNIVGIYNCEKIDFPDEMPNLMAISHNMQYPQQDGKTHGKHP